MSALPTAEDLPAPLVTREQWVAWRPQERDGKQTKVPINPSTGRFASATDPETWTDFATAREYATGKSGGLGFVFTDEDPIVGVDLDDCRVPETGSLTEEAEAIVEELDSYTEVSPSGTGVHVLVEGKLPDGRNRRDWVECYETARFFTVSGEHVEETPADIRSRTDELVRVHGRFLAPDESSDSPGDEEAVPEHDESEGNTVITSESDAGASLSDTAVVERAQSAANGEKFSRLWRGSTSGYDSHSEADMALCSILAFWTGGDAAQIDRLFRDSGLMRPKWDEQHYADGSTYGEKTIERVVASTDEVYDPGRSASESTPEAAAAVDESPAPSEGNPAGHSPPNEGPSQTPTTAEGSTQTAPQSGAPERSAEAETTSATAAPMSGDDVESSGSPGTPIPADLSSDTDVRVMSIVEELQAEVERLDAENKRLREQLDEQAAANDTASDDSELSRFSRLKRWVLR